MFTVIDFCLTKHMVCDQETNYSSLQIQWASHANCKQRKGRAGRVANGRVYRFVTRKFYEDNLPDYSTPEMQVSILAKSIVDIVCIECCKASCPIKWLIPTTPRRMIMFGGDGCHGEYNSFVVFPGWSAKI